jgi:hypothetical protein
MSSLQCPTTLLLLPARELDPDDLSRLASRKLARVWTEPTVARAADAVAERLGVGVTVAAFAGSREVLAEIADEHPGETVLVLIASGDPAEVVVDADGWLFKPFDAP